MLQHLFIEILFLNVSNKRYWETFTICPIKVHSLRILIRLRTSIYMYQKLYLGHVRLTRHTTTRHLYFFLRVKNNFLKIINFILNNDKIGIYDF